MSAKAGSPINEKIYTAGVWDSHVLSHAGSLIGGLELSGLDPKGLSESDFSMVAGLLRNVLQSLSDELVVSQYYWHFEGAKVRFRERENARSQMLSQRRADFLNRNGGLSGSRLYWLLECPPQENINSAGSLGALRALFSSPFEAKARAKLKAMLTSAGAWLLESEELTRQGREVEAALGSLSTRLEALSAQNRNLDIPDLWALMRALINLNPSYLDQGLNEAVPGDHWDQLLPDGDITPVTVDGLDCLKIDGAVPVYARIVSVGGYGDEYVPEGVWGSGPMPVSMQHGNYLVVTRFSPLSTLKRSLMLSGKKNELHRSQMSFGALMKGEVDSGEVEKKIRESKELRMMVEELEDAANTSDRYGHFHSHVVLFETDPSKLRAASRKIHDALSRSGLHPVWESVGLLSLFPQLLPGYPKRCHRSTEFNTSQAGACSLIFKSSEGVREWGPKKEEALYILESEDGSPFHYTPFIGDKCLVLGVGPTRGGKTFMKNVMAGHFMKFGGLYHAIDIDPGSEPLARFFKEDGGIFRLDGRRGFNPFVAATGENDPQFSFHLMSQLRLMQKLNDSEKLQELEPYEQEQLDRGQKAVLGLPDSMRHAKNLSGLFEHATELKPKFSRWLKGGMYGDLFDNVEDGIGTLDKKVAVYNLASVKDTPALASLAMNEVFFRVTRLFESPEYRTTPKFLEMDEAHYVLSIPGAAERAVAKARTWFKHGGGMGFWTQSPDHYMAVPEWETLRAAATTFIFMADQQMNPEKYKEAFHLTDGECEAIQNLIPRKQAYIVQREAGVSKVVNVNVAPEEYVIATSRPDEAVIVNQMLEQYPDIDEAVNHMVKAIFPEESNEKQEA